EKISGQSYADFVQQNILTPLEMKDSGYGSNSAIIPHRAAGYAPTTHGLVNADYIDMSIPFPAGGLYSTVDDLLRWEQALFGGKVLSAASLAKMITPFQEGYALGVSVQTIGRYKVIEHNGRVEGFNTALAYYPDDKLVVAVLANVSRPLAQDIATKL